MASFSAKLVTRAPLSARVEHLVFEAEQPFPRQAGQYAFLTLKDGGKHAFSLASPYSPQAPGRFEIAAARGTTAAALLRLPVGGVVDVEGPGGSLVWKEDAPALFVATGTGISPLRAILLEQLARDTLAPVTVLFGCRDASEELWGAELTSLAQQCARFRYLPTQSQPQPGFAGRTGRVQAHLPALAQALGVGGHAYLCGHTPMVRECSALLVAGGVPAERIHGESY